jgi:hypothetical protein
MQCDEQMIQYSAKALAWADSLLITAGAPLCQYDLRHLLPGN